MADGATLGSLISRDRLWVSVSSLATTALDWVYLVRMGWHHERWVLALSGAALVAWDILVVVKEL